MTRTLLATLITACGLTSASHGQIYYNAPAYSYYSPYTYTTGYGPLGVFSPRAWFGAPVSYSSPFYGTTYTAAYSPAYTYTASYSPSVTTSYYASSVASACCAPACCTPCCASCSTCSSCSSGTCASGNCSLNYAPSAALRPEPDPAASGSSGKRTFESESNGARGDSFGPARDRAGDGFDEDGEYGAGYGPQQKIERRAPADEPEAEAAEAEASEAAEAPRAEDSTPANNGTGTDTNDTTTTPDNSSSGLGAPGANDQPEAVLPALNLDTRIVAAPSLLRERTRMKARFGSPQLARSTVDPATLPAAVDVRLVRK